MSHLVAIINGKKPSTGVGGVSDADLSNVPVNFLSAGVVGENDYKISQQTSPNMTVKATAGYCYVPKADGSNVYVSHLDADANVTITNNVSGNPRIDAIVIKIDLGATPNNYANNVATLVAVPGTPAASPVAPTDNAIQTAVGAGNPFIRLANVAVANGAGTITDANITNTRVWSSLKTLPYPAINAPTYAASINLSMAKNNTHVITLTGNPTLAVSNVRVGQYFAIELIQDGNGNRTVSWFSTIKWVGGVTPTLTTTANKKDTFIFRCTSAGNYDGYIVGQNI